MRHTRSRRRLLVGLVLVELECISPFPFLGRDTDAPDRFADAVLDRTTTRLASDSP